MWTLSSGEQRENSWRTLANFGHSCEVANECPTRARPPLLLLFSREKGLNPCKYRACNDSFAAEASSQSETMRGSGGKEGWWWWCLGGGGRRA